MDKTVLTYEAICRLPAGELEQLIREGTTPELDGLAGWEFRGYNVAPATELLRIRKFKKGFYREPGQSEGLWGYNVKVRQNGLLNPWMDRMQGGEPVRHALYSVYQVRSEDRDNLYQQALMLNYGQGANPLLDPSQLLRDYLVQVTPDNSDLLLGKGYLAFGPLRVFGGYFVLGRYGRGIPD